jgi:hypothetical protein
LADHRSIERRFADRIATMAGRTDGAGITAHAGDGAHDTANPDAVKRD